MKIQSISSIMPYSANRKQNYSPNFEGSLSVSQLKKYPLEKKLAHMFSACDIGDVIAVGKNFDEIVKGLSRTVEGFSDIIKRIFFVKDSRISNPMAFEIPHDEDWICINIGDKDLKICNDEQGDTLEPDDSSSITEGDIIINNNVNIPIGMFVDLSDKMDDSEDMDLLTNPESFATKTCNFEDIQQKWIEKANAEALETLQTNKKSKGTETKKLSFKDVGGMDETIETLKRSVLYPIKYPFAYSNVAFNKGILLYGKPGTGKTLLAEALAGESNAEFIKLCATDFESQYYGKCEESWRNLFAEARKKQPAIIFIDEFDAVVKNRGQSVNAHHDDKIVNQILSLMSDLEKSDDNVFVIATTNKPETIDSAIMRSGRFGKHIEIPVPDRKGLESIFNIHMRNKTADPQLDKGFILDQFFSRQFTGADVKHVVNEAHTNSWIRAGIYEKMEAGTLTPGDMNKVLITKEDFEAALKDWDKTQTSKARKPIGYK